jgi:hypothetical protein
MGKVYLPGSEPRADAQSENLAKRTLMVPELMLTARLPAGLWRQVLQYILLGKEVIELLN